MLRSLLSSLELVFRNISHLGAAKIKNGRRWTQNALHNDCTNKLNQHLKLKTFHVKIHR